MQQHHTDDVNFENTTSKSEPIEALSAPRQKKVLWSTSVVAAQVLLPLALVIWFAHFWHSSQFGLYEDDWGIIPPVMGIGWHDLWKVLLSDLPLAQTFGRPVGTVLIHFFSFLGFKAGGLAGIYDIAFLILLTNAMLFYALLKKIFDDRRFAFLGALAFAVFPADTTQSYLVHGLYFQPAITLLLIALLSYIAGWKISSYIAIFLSLFAYETVICVFAIAPVLQRRGRREIIKHCLILAAMLACVTLLRAVAADSRVSQMGIRDLMLGMGNLIVGPLTCLAMYIYRPVQELFNVTKHELTVLSAFCVGLALILSKVLLGSAAPSERVSADRVGANSWRPLMIGTVMLLAAYPMTFSTVGIAVAGRGTRVHFAAILGASIMCAWLVSRILNRLRVGIGTAFSIVSVACYFTLLIGSGMTVQRDYVLSWQEQRGFWTDLVRLCPDLGDGDAIFVEPTGLRDTRQLLFLRRDLYGVPETRQIKSLDILKPVLPNLYAFPKEWKRPEVYRLPRDWEQQLFGSDETLRLVTIEAEQGRITVTGDVPKTDIAWDTVSASKAIFLETKNGRLTRRAELVNPASGTRVRLKTDSILAEHLTGLPMYHYLIIPPGHQTASYLVN